MTLRKAPAGKGLPHLPVSPDDLADNVLDNYRGQIAVLFYLLPPFAHDALDTLRPDGSLKPVVERAFRDTLGDSPDIKRAQAMTGAEKVRLLILHHGGPSRIQHGEQRELCIKHKIHPSVFSRELRKLYALMRSLKIPRDWFPFSWRP